MMLYLGSLALFGLGFFLVRTATPHGRKGGDKFEKVRRRKRRGIFLMVVAVFPVAVGLTKQLISSDESTESTPSSEDTSQSDMARDTPLPRQSIELTNNVPTPLYLPTSESTDQPQADPITVLLSQAFDLLKKKQFDGALAKVNAALQSAPQNAEAFGLRGNIYAQMKLWDQAGKDYRQALHLDDKNTVIKFNLAETEFAQKRYDEARPGYVALEQVPDMTDLVTYKVFLCDLFGGHEDVAARELDAFNQVDANASYYFANAAWFLYHKKTEDARGWLASAVKIYAPAKFMQYSASLIYLGYMPLPAPGSPSK